MEQRFQECRVVHDQPGYYTDDDCLTACMRDPKCPLKYTPQVKERVRTLCRQETSNARKVHFAVGFADVCRAVLEVGEVFVDGRFEMMSGDAPTRLELQTPWWVYSRGGV